MAKAKKTAKPKKQPKPFFKERRAFISRILENTKPSNYALEMQAVTKIFELFDNDIDFLSKVKMPFKMNGSIKWLLTSEGIDYMNKKYKEFNFKPKEAPKIIDSGQKFGEDIYMKNKQTLRGFLNDE